jgi:hypothetical protein
MDVHQTPNITVDWTRDTALRTFMDRGMTYMRPYQIDSTSFIDRLHHLSSFVNNEFSLPSSASSSSPSRDGLLSQWLASSSTSSSSSSSLSSLSSTNVQLSSTIMRCRAIAIKLLCDASHPSHPLYQPESMPIIQCAIIRGIRSSTSGVATSDDLKRLSSSNACTWNIIIESNTVDAASWLVDASTQLVTPYNRTGTLSSIVSTYRHGRIDRDTITRESSIPIYPISKLKPPPNTSTGAGGRCKVHHLVIPKRMDNNINVVLKQPSPIGTMDRQYRAHHVLTYEMQRLWSIQYHPGVVVLKGRTDLEDDAPAAIMESMPLGETLADYLVSTRALRSPPSVINRLRLLRRIAATLADLHGMSKPLAHGDLRPCNIWLSRTLTQPAVNQPSFEAWNDDSVKLFDFACARPNGATRVYVAPEHINNDGITSVTSPSGDVWSLALLAFDILMLRRTTLHAIITPSLTDSSSSSSHRDGERQAIITAACIWSLTAPHALIRNMVSSCLSADPLERPSMIQCERWIDQTILDLDLNASIVVA